MKSTTPDNQWWPNFRRAIAFLGPHRRQLIIGLVMAVFVSVFYTFSVSSVIPLLKVIFARDETLVDWIHRVEVQRRLDIVIGADLPNDPSGLEIDHVRSESRSDHVLNERDTLIAVDGENYSSYEFMRVIAQHPTKDMQNVLVRHEDGTDSVIDLKLRRYHWWSSALRHIVQILPTGRDSTSRWWTLVYVMIALVVVTTLSAMFRFLNEWFVAASVQKAMHDMRSSLANHVMNLPVDWHSNQPTGDTLGRFATDINKVEVGMTTLFGKMIQEPLKAAGVFTLTLLIDWKLLIVALLGIPLGAFVIRALGRAVKRAQKRASRSWGRLLDLLSERLTGIRVVKAYNMEDAEAERFELEGRKLTHAQTSIEVVDAATKPALETLAVIGVAAFILYGGSRVFENQLEPNLFFAAVVCMGGLFDPVRKMGNVNNRLQQADASAKRIYEMFDTKTEEIRADVPAMHEMTSLESSIEFRDVTFAYPTKPDINVVENVSFKIKKGQVVAVVGPNGSGKTTLMSLLLRFYKPQHGEIYIDNHDISTFSLGSLRSNIGLVTQEAIIFSDTVHGNIAYGCPDASIEQVRAAAKLAHIDDFVQDLKLESDGSVSTGYHVLVSTRTLSGGQRQRIALARAILRDPPILILDEATSQIDTESERKIQEAIEDVTRGRTTFIIAHRYSTISRADTIIVMNEGRVVDYGPHDELIATSPFYETLCRTQFAHA